MPTAANLSLPSVAAAPAPGSAAAAAPGSGAARPESHGASFADLFDLTLALAGGTGAVAATAPGAPAGAPAGGLPGAARPGLVVDAARARILPDGGVPTDAGHDKDARGDKAGKDRHDAAATPDINPLAAALATLLPAALPHDKTPAVTARGRSQGAVVATERRSALPASALPALSHHAAKAGSTDMQSAVAAKIAADHRTLPGDAAGNEAFAQAGTVSDTTAATAQAVAAGAGLAQTTRPDGPPVQLTVQAPLQSSAWGSELGQKVVWMVGNQTPSAQLHLNPAHLGPVQVQLTVAGNQVNAVIIAHHEQTRDAIQAALPQLRATLADSGLSLGQAQVGSGGGGAQGGAGQWSPPPQTRAPLVTPVRVGSNGPVLVGLSATGSVDTFV